MLFKRVSSSSAEPLTMDRSFSNWGGRSALAAVIMGALCPLAMQFDVPLSLYFRGWDLPGDLQKAIDLSEAFAHGLGVATILLVAWVISVHRRQAIAVAMLITLLSGAIANGLKAAVIRVRPHAEGLEVVAHDQPAGPDAVQASFWDARQRSFPSGHTATAWGLAIGLSLVYTRGWILFSMLATLASLQRLTSGAHFPSDVLAGMAIALLCSACVLSIRPLRQVLTL